MHRTTFHFRLLLILLITTCAQATSKTVKKTCKKPAYLPKTALRKQGKCSGQAFTQYLEKKGINGFKEAINILKTVVPDQGTNLEKRIAVNKISNSAQVAQANYIKQQNINLNRYGINDKALTTLIGTATAARLAPFYIAGRFTTKDLEEVERYISSGGRDEHHIQSLLNMA